MGSQSSRNKPGRVACPPEQSSPELGGGWQRALGQGLSREWGVVWRGLACDGSSRHAAACMALALTLLPILSITQMGAPPCLGIPVGQGSGGAKILLT